MATYLVSEQSVLLHFLSDLTDDDLDYVPTSSDNTAQSVLHAWQKHEQCQDRVTKLNNGSDGIIRSTHLVTGNGHTIHRSVTHLYLLEMSGPSFASGAKDNRPRNPADANHSSASETHNSPSQKTADQPQPGLREELP